MLDALQLHTGPAAAGLLAVFATLLFVALALPRLRAAAGTALAAGLGAALLVAVFALPLSWGVALCPALAALLGGTLGQRSRPRAVELPLRSAAAPTVTPARKVAAPMPASTARTEAPGRSRPATLGRYRIDGELGRGAMGAVYLAHDPQIGRPVAVKTMALGHEFEGDELNEARARFFREAETAGRLQHPDIVTIFDAGEAQDLAYIAMELLKGHDLQRHTKLGQLLPPPQVLAIVARVADALAYAHSQGVVHRDVKPANVMVDLDSDTVKVTDFGIARITDSSRTRTGMVLGTPSFMSPEQMAGRRVDGRSDLYSVGVMLFQLLTGTLPHRSDSMAKLMYAIANEPAPDIRTLRPDLPAALADLVALALEKRPEVRYSDGRQLAADLRAIAAQAEPASVTKLPPGPRDVAAEDGFFEATVKFSRPEPRHNSDSGAGH